MDHQTAIQSSGAIPRLVDLLSTGTEKTKEYAAKALGKLAANNEVNKKEIVNAGAIETLAKLSKHDYHKNPINEAIVSLVLTTEGQTIGITDYFMNELVNIYASENSPETRELIAKILSVIANTNKIVLINTNEAINALVAMAKQKTTPMGREKIASAINIIAGSDEGLYALVNAGAINAIVTLAKQENTESGRKAIADAIRSIIEEEVPDYIINNMIEEGAITELISMMKKENTKDGERSIGYALEEFAKTKDGITALINAGTISALVEVSQQFDPYNIVGIMEALTEQKKV